VSASLHVVRETNLLDVPATLRELADSMEAGAYGEMLGCVVVWDADDIGISYCGGGEAGPRAMLLLQVGLGKMVASVIDAKADDGR
jgi:hypothetical protein